MARGPTYRVQFRRRREFKTNYRKRAKLLASGRTRAVVRKTLRQIIVQFVDFDPQGDRIVAAGTSKEIRKFGWRESVATIPAAYLTGFVTGLKARKKGIQHAILDTGYHTPVKGGKIFAAVKGILEAGIEIPHNTEYLPQTDRLSSAEIAETKQKIVAATGEQ